ncbi:O-antigen ligase family protein [Alkalibacillus sp. S2W]|uniref:O-antigen ligase family protein n=1 Tax=Alkalibacillus sp. S2W TaxID=3386553 RepID=UPI00398CBB3A
MINYNQVNIIHKLFGFTVFYLLLFNVLGLMTFEPYRELGRETSLWVLYLSVFIVLYDILINRGINRNFKSIYIGFGLLITSYTITHIFNKNFTEDTTLLILFLTFCFILSITKINWIPNHFRIMGITSIIILTLFFFDWITEGYPTYRFTSFFTNSNVTGLFLYFLLFFQITSIKFFSRKVTFTLIVLSIFINLFLIYTTTTRSVLLSIAIILFSWLLVKYSQKLYYYLFHVVISFNFIFIISYTYLSNSEYANSLNELSQKWFGKSFFSGREEIWGSAIEYGLNSPWIGHFVGVTPKEYVNGSNYVHTHNQYVQVFLESGLFGVLAFIILLTIFWKFYHLNINSHIVQWSSFFFLGMLIHQNTSMTFYYQYPVMGLIHWMIVSIGISVALKKYRLLS